MAAFFAIILVFSIFVSPGLSVPLVSAQSALPLSIAPNGLPSTYSSLQAHQSLDSITGGSINQYTDSQTYPYQDSYQVPTSPIQTLPDESLPFEEQQLPQENSLVDFTAPETTISSIVDGNNVQLQEGATTTSNKVVLTIQGTDDIAVTGFQCVLDNLQQDPSICGTNPVVAENLQPGPHLFQISSVDSFGNMDNTPAVFSWNVALSDQYIGGQQASQQFQQQQQPMLPLQQQLPMQPFQEEMMLPYQTNISPYATVAPDPSNNATNIYENQQALQLSQSFLTANPTLASPQYPITDPSQYLDPRQSQYQRNIQQQPLQQPLQQPSQNISTLQQPTVSSSLLPFLTLPFDYPQLHEQQIATANKTWNSGSGQNQNLAPLEPQTQDNQPLQLSNASFNSTRIPLSNDNNRSAITTDRETNSPFPTSSKQEASLGGPFQLPENTTSTLDSLRELGLSSIPPYSTSNISTNINPELSLQSTLNETSLTMAPLVEEAGEKIPNQYIVVLKNRLTLPSEVAAEAKSRGASILNIYERVLNGFAIRVPNDRVLEAIQRIPNVAYVEQDMRVHEFAQTVPTGVNRVDGDLSSTKSGSGFGSVNADIAIIDTGIDLDHPDLFVHVQKTFVLGTTSANDDRGHGTHVAGIAAAKDNAIGVVGVAPGARLWAVKVLDSSGSGSISTIIKGVDYVTGYAPWIDVANMSLGCECTSTSLNTAISNSVKAGVVYVVAAGNSNKNAATFSPANHPSVIAVSAIADSDGKCGRLGPSTSRGADDTLASFSNYGSLVDLAAPGVNIYSTYKDGTYATLSGTSMAAPHVAGMAALHDSRWPTSAPLDVLKSFQRNGSNPSTICDGKGHGYFYGDRDSYRESLLYKAFY